MDKEKYDNVKTDNENMVCFFCHRLIGLGERYRKSGSWFIHSACYKEQREKHLKSD